MLVVVVNVGGNVDGESTVSAVALAVAIDLLGCNQVESKQGTYRRRQCLWHTDTSSATATTRDKLLLWLMQAVALCGSCIIVLRAVAAKLCCACNRAPTAKDFNHNGDFQHAEMQVLYLLVV